MGCALCGGCLCTGSTKAPDGKSVHPGCLQEYIKKVNQITTKTSVNIYKNDLEYAIVTDVKT